MNNCSFYPGFTTVYGWHALVALQFLLGIVALVGNVIVFSVILRAERLYEKHAYKFILSLSLADIIVGLLAQPMLAGVLVVGVQHHCALEQISHFLGSLSSAASGVGLVVISIDRVIYISKPMKYEYIMTTKRVCALIAYVWLLALICAIIPFLTSSLIAYHAIVFGGMTFNSSLMIVCYALIFKTVLASAKSMPTHKMSSHEHKQNQATRTIAFIVVAFLICWWPFSAVSFFWALNEEQYGPASAMVSSYYWLLGLGHWNSALNVIIYSWKNTELRREMRKFIGLKRAVDDDSQTWVSEQPRPAIITTKGQEIRDVSSEEHSQA